MTERMIRATSPHDTTDTGEPLYWANAGGWVEYRYADRYLPDEQVSLPVGGQWVEVGDHGIYDLTVTPQDTEEYLAGDLLLPGATETGEGVVVLRGTLSRCRWCQQGIYADDRGDGSLIWCHDHGSTVCHDTPAGSVQEGPTASPDGTLRRDMEET